MGTSILSGSPTHRHSVIVVTVYWSELQENTFSRFCLLRSLNCVVIRKMRKGGVRIDIPEALDYSVFKNERLVRRVKVLAFGAVADVSSVVQPAIILIVGGAVAFSDEMGTISNGVQSGRTRRTAVHVIDANAPVIHPVVIVEIGPVGVHPPVKEIARQQPAQHVLFEFDIYAIPGALAGVGFPDIRTHICIVDAEGIDTGALGYFYIVKFRALRDIRPAADDSYHLEPLFA